MITAPHRLDETRPFRAVGVAVLTVSDSRDRSQDRSGDFLERRVIEAGHELVARTLLPDDTKMIEEQLRAWIGAPAVEVVITIGGTGVTGRDVTPEAIEAVAEKVIPGFGELFRWISYPKIGTSTLQSRALGAVARGTYLFAVPGSTGACRDAWDEILRWQLDVRHQPCNLVELLPRLREHESS